MTKEYTCEYCGCILTEEEICDFNGHIACEDCEIHLYTCNCCGETVDDRDVELYETEDGDIICEDCADDYYNRCGECGTYVRNGDIHDAINIYGREVHICQRCANENYVVCADCGSMVHIDNATYDEYEEEYYCNNCWNVNDLVNSYRGEYLRVFRTPNTFSDFITVCYETDFQSLGVKAYPFNIIPEWIDMTIKENPAQRLRTLEIVAETF